MKKTLVTIIGFVLAALAAIGAQQPLASPAVIAQTECACKDLKTLQIELRNAIRLQEAFRNKIPELRKENVSTSKYMLQVFAKGEARRGLEEVPNYNGPKEYDYVSWGETQDIDYISKSKTMDEICDFSASSNDLLKAAKEASACAGIGEALQAHENWHRNFCLRIGYRPYLTMHGADRAREEVEAYGEQIKVLREIIARLRCGYRATGKTADLVYSGVICSLEKPFTVYGTNAAIKYVFEFVPSSATSGTVTHSGMGSMVTAAGGGPYTIEGADTDKPRIALAQSGVGRSPVGSRNYSGTIYIDLVPLDTDECKQP